MTRRTTPAAWLVQWRKVGGGVTLDAAGGVNLWRIMPPHVEPITRDLADSLAAALIEELDTLGMQGQIRDMVADEAAGKMPDTQPETKHG